MIVNSLAELHKALEEGKLSAVEVVQGYLDNIQALEPKVNAFITVTAERALARAARIDADRAKGLPLGKLAGLPIAIKDVILTKDVRSTGGSQILSSYVPPYRATAIERLLDNGAVVVGKTNCDEFAMGGSGENSSFGPTHNPWDLSRVPGGTSSGSAAAVAAGECLAALGSDTGGSVRQPASFCGLVGLKPTYGRVSRYGLMAMTSSFDQIGPITRSVEDTALLLGVIAGHDEQDATSSNQPVPDYVVGLQQGIKGLRVGMPKEFFAEGLVPAVADCVRVAIAEIEKLGATIVQVSLPSMPYALAAYYVICPAEVSANMARYDGMRYGSREPGATLTEVYQRTRGKYLGPEVKRRIMLGTYVLSGGYYDAYYRTAQAARVAIRADFAKVFAQVDMLVTPTAPTVAYPLGGQITNPLAMYLADVYTVPVNIAGLPAISVPCGFVKEGGSELPVGLQFIGQAWGEVDILRAAHVYEQATPWHRREPKF